MENWKLDKKVFKKNWKKIVAVFSILGAFVAAVLIREQVFFKSRAFPGDADLSINPPTLSVNPGGSSSVEVFVTPNGENVAGVELLMNYDPSVITVTGIDPGVFFTPQGVGSPIEIIEDLSTPGRIYYALAFPLGSNYSSTTAGVAAKLTLML